MSGVVAATGKQQVVAAAVAATTYAVKFAVIKMYG